MVYKMISKLTTSILGKNPNATWETNRMEVKIAMRTSSLVFEPIT